MTIIIFLFLLFTLVTARYTQNNEDYLSKRYTNIIKGFFLFFVFIRHFLQYNLPFDNNWYDSIGMKLNSKLGQLIVVMFLFYSGYGIMESFKKKGEKYVDGIPKKRIFNTWFHFAIAVFIYMIASQYFITHDFSIKKIVLAFIGWDSFGNSNWYIFTIIILYFITYLSLKSFKDKKHILASMFLGTLLFTKILSFYKDGYWYNTAFFFFLGSVISMYKEDIEKWLTNKELISLFYAIFLFIIAYVLRKNIIWYHISTCAFAIIVLLVTRKIQIKNIALEWMGKNLFPLYIFQRLPMMLLNKIEYIHNSPYLFFVIAAIATIGIAIIYNCVMHISGKLYNKIKEKKAKCLP